MDLRAYGHLTAAERAARADLLERLRDHPGTDLNDADTRTATLLAREDMIGVGGELGGKGHDFLRQMGR